MNEPRLRDHPIPREMAILTMAVVLLWGLSAGRTFFIPLALASLLAFLASPIMRVQRSKGVPEWLAIVVAVCLFLIPVLWVGYMLLRQVQSIISDYPSIIASLRIWALGLTKTAWGQRLHLDQHLTVESMIAHVGAGAGEGMRFLAHGITRLLEAGTELALISLLAVIMLASREHLYLSAEKMLRRFESIEASKLLEAVTEMIEQFLITKLLVIAIVGLLSFGALQLLGLKYAFLLGMMTGILTLIPEVGFVVGLIPVAVVAIATGHTGWSITLQLGSMVIVHLIEANIFTPKLVGKKLNINMFASFLGFFAGGLLWGVWGMLLSVPILGILRILCSTSASLHPIAFFLSEKEDTQFGLTLLNRAVRAERLKQLLARVKKDFVES